MHLRRSTLSFIALLTASLIAAPQSAQAFDLEDYATTARATRDHYFMAANEVALAASVFARARIAAELMGFGTAEGEALFWPLTNYRPTITNRTDEPCDGDDRCNATATCNGGFCGAPSNPHPIVNMTLAEWQQARHLFVRSIEIGDTLSATSVLWPLDLIESSFNGDSVHINWEKGNANQALSFRIESFPLTDVEAENDFGLIVPLHYDTETVAWPVDPIEDAGPIEATYWSYIATRAALLKAVAELEFARGPYMAARDTYVVATEKYTALISCVTPMAEIAPEWFCVARPTAGAPVRCVCNLGEGRCQATTPAIIVNEPAPASSFALCREPPAKDCICAVDDLGSPCTAPANRYYN